jgi:hypothetical protein
LGVTALLALSLLVNVRKQMAGRAQTTCKHNEQALVQAMLLYLADYDQAFPPADAWCDVLVPYLSSVGSFVCPTARNRNCSYAFSAPLGGVKAGAIEDAWLTVMLFESDAGWNATGGPELLPDEPRHAGGDNWAFADGRAFWRSRKRVADSQGTWLWTRQEDTPDYRRWQPVLRETGKGR